MTKIVYNGCYGGFGLSHEAIMRYAELKGITLYTENIGHGFNSYYLCTPEEYDRINTKEQANPVSPGRFDRSNSLYFCDRDIDRTDPALVQAVEELGERANTTCAKLRIVDIPTGTLYQIDEYDGLESVKTQDAYDWKVA